MDDNTLTVNRLTIGRSNPVRVMGVINLSPESFYTSSVVTESQDILDRVNELVAEGADILDIGAASTAPKNHYGTEETNIKVELGRVAASLKIIAENVEIPISIDTTSAKVAETALDCGASIVNDVTGLQKDPLMADLVAERDVPIVIMAHCQDGCKSVNDSLDVLRKSLEIADTAGICRERIIIDPGIGFGKPAEVDCAILRKLEEYKQFQRPLLVGVSRKAFIGIILNEENPENRLIGSLAATSVAVVNGANIIRTHDVRETKSAVRLAEALR
jgi:dihydropteroate synthase